MYNDICSRTVPERFLGNVSEDSRKVPRRFRKRQGTAGVQRERRGRACCAMMNVMTHFMMILHINIQMRKYT